jgi:ABC-type protease/lipase transport system fused ATPase/permease subunit
VRTLLADAPRSGERTRLPAPVGYLKLDTVFFAPPGSNALVIKGVSFSLQPGEVLGLIGPSAAGKTTLARLIVGSWHPQRGSVRLDGAELRHWDRDLLGAHIGYLPQDVELFAGTVRDNIARMGEGPDEAVIEAARQACLHDMILDLPDGYDTEIGDSGALLSGGQRQRIALARALYGRPKLLMLDEPNASLDSAGETGLLQTLAALKQQGATIVLTTHRVNLLAITDKILLLQGGAVAAYGSRDDVMPKLIRAVPDIASRPRAEPLPRGETEAMPRQLAPEPSAGSVRPLVQGEEGGP